MKFESDSIDFFADSRPISDCRSASDMLCLFALLIFVLLEAELSISCRYAISLSSFSVGFVLVEMIAISLA